ncbi:MAG TPA: anti-sigma factor [Solirubrobacteraceae bacterium]|nr:anti-sigma factor [Solirubrobacteraceae bacterium]
MTARDDDRVAYLAGEEGPALPDEEAAALDVLRAELRSPAAWEEPPADLEVQVVMAVTQAAGTDGGRVRGTSADGGRQRAPSASWWERVRAGLSRRRGLALSLSLPVAAAAAVAIVLITTSSSAPPELQFAMVVQGTALTPAAHGSATLTKHTSGWEIKLSASGLPRREGRQFYEAWLKNAAGILVPVGTFNDARDVTLWSGVPVTKFRSLSVTQQVLNGNPASSGRRVLAGTIH